MSDTPARPRTAALVLTALWLAGCGDSSGAGGGTSTGGHGSGGSGGSGGGAGGSEDGCSGSEVCAPPASGWLGPRVVVRHASGEVAVCPAGQAPEPLGLAELAPGTFGCSCGDCATSGTCGGGAIETFVNGGCTQPTQPIALTSGVCVTPALSPLRMQVAPPDPANVTCTADPVQTGDKAAYAAALASCDPGAPTACASGSCVDPAGSEGVCVVRAGDHACPAPYATKTLVHAGLSDDRSCGCDCAITAASCDGSVTGFWGDQCTGNQEVLPTTCYEGPANSAFLSNYALTASCTATSTELGAVTELEPTTVCCLPK